MPVVSLRQYKLFTTNEQSKNGQPVRNDGFFFVQLPIKNHEHSQT